MICQACYKKVKDGYCLSCRKKLFDKARVPAILPFDSPQPNKLGPWLEHSRQMSISGVQLKYSLHLDKDNLVLSNKESQYIIKPIPLSTHLEELHDTPENEHLTMQIADQLFGIETAANALIHFQDGYPAYITRRFDVRPDGSKYLQEDFAQLTNRSRKTHGDTFKYTGSYEEIGLLIKRYVAASLPALEQFFKLIVFNYLISNGDAHLKNFSLIRTDKGEYRLTPAYDLLSTVIHTPLESDIALDLYPGDVDSDYYSIHGYYGRENFMEFARRLGIIEIRAARMIDQFLYGHEQIEALVHQSFLSEEAKAKYIFNLADKAGRLEQPVIL
jgi:serine/threonine-protein kinase HipA